MFSTKSWIQIGLVVAALMGFIPRSSAQTISCSSVYCQADTRGGVQLLKQPSDSACREGYSWGYDRRGIWVDHGCRADFQVGR